MTLAAWRAALSPDDLHNQLSDLSARKLHLLTSAFLRRVWDQLPSHHTRTAVEATEKFAAGRITVDQLAHLRSTDLLESAELLWAHPGIENREERLIGRGWVCPCCEPFLDEYERRVMTSRKGFDGVKAGIEEPAWIAAQSAFLARDLVAWAADPNEQDGAAKDEAVAQHELLREVVWPWMNPLWPEWRTETVRLIARGIHRERSFSLMPILADALQDAGCEDEIVLSHCRNANEHIPGCWVIDLAMGKV